MYSETFPKLFKAIASRLEAIVIELFDAIFLVAWLALQWYVGRAKAIFALDQLEEWVFIVFRIVFSMLSLLVVIRFAKDDIVDFVSSVKDAFQSRDSTKEVESGKNTDSTKTAVSTEKIESTRAAEDLRNTGSHLIVLDAREEKDDEPR